MHADQRAIERARADGNRGIIRLCRAQQLGELVDGRREIGVGEQDPAAPGLEHSVTHGVAFPAIAGIAQQAHARVSRGADLDQRRGAIARSVIHHQDLRVGERAAIEPGKNGIQGGGKTALFVIRRDHDGERQDSDYSEEPGIGLGRNPGRLKAMSVPTVRAVPLLNLRAQHDEIRAEIREAMERVIESQQFILGAEVEQFERRLAEYCGVGHAIGCASGSDAVLLALKAAGIGPGDEVITTPYTFFATAGAIVHAGARPVFADIEPVSFNLDPARFEDAAKRHPQARAVIPVHLFGACAQMEAIGDIARRRQMVVIEDAAQAIGAEHNGTRAGGLSAIACFSFFPTKNLAAFGDGGALTTRDAELAARLRVLRMHGSRERYLYEEVGYNSRLDALQAAVLSVKLRHLDTWTAARQRNAELYRQRLAGAGLPIALPSAQPWQSRHVYHHFNIRAARRDALRAFLMTEGIGAEVYYPKPLHLQECFGGLGYRAGDFPEAERLAAEALALPVHSELHEGDIDAVAGAIKRFYQGS